MKKLLSLLDPIFSDVDKKVGLEESQLLKGHLKNIHTLLDYGCGSGIAGETIAKKCNLDVTGADLEDNRLTDIKFQKISDNRTSFPDKKFDAVLLSFVLHHTTNAENIIDEAKRLAKLKIFIFEDTPKDIWDKLQVNIHGALFKLFFGLKDNYKFRSRNEWLDLFKQKKLRIDAIKNAIIKNPIHNPERTLFVLSFKIKVK